MRGSLVRALRTKVSDARACVEKRSHLVVVALFVIVRVINRASSEESDRTRLSFCRIRIRRVRLRRPYTHPRLDSTRVSARSRDAYVTILHFRAVIDGVDASRCALDLDASSFAFLSFLSFPPLIHNLCQRRHVAHVFRCAPGNRSADKYCLQLVQYLVSSSSSTTPTPSCARTTGEMLSLIHI